MGNAISTGLSGVLAAKYALGTIGSNITNASTPGYVRRTTVLASSGTGGVQVSGTLRIKDLVLESRLLTYSSSLNCQESATKYLGQVEALLQEPSDNGISACLDEFFNQWQAVANNPESTTDRALLISAAAQLADRLTTLRKDLVTMREDVMAEIKSSVTAVNALLEQVADTNELLQQSSGQSGSNLGLTDQREQLLRDLAKLVGAQDNTPHENSAQVMIGSAVVVSGSGATSLNAPKDWNGSFTIGQEGSTAAIQVTGGSLAGLMGVVQNVLPEMISRLDRFAVDLMHAVNAIYAEGVNASGGYTSLTSAIAVKDVNGNGDSSDDLLANAGLASPPTAGTLTINVTDASGNVVTSVLNIDPQTQSLADVAAAINGLANVSSQVVDGKLQITTTPGHRINFCAEQGTDLLAVLQINAFFTGESAANIQVASNLRNNAAAVACGRTGDSGDGSNALRIAELTAAKVANSDTATLSAAWAEIVTYTGSVALESQKALESAQTMYDIISEQEQSVSGVSLDEEAAKLIEYQQMYSVCARYLSTVSKLTDILLNYL